MMIKKIWKKSKVEKKVVEEDRVIDLDWEESISLIFLPDYVDRKDTVEPQASHLIPPKE